MALKYGVGFGRTNRIDEVVAHAQLAEDLGYEHMTFIDSQNLSRDNTTMMALAAANTSRIRIGPGVTQPHTRHMAVVANGIATIDELSGGRAFLGIGAGMSATGVLAKQPRRLRELAEAVQFFRAFTSGEEASWKGVQMHSEWIRRAIPVIIGSDGPRGMRQAAKIADGTFCPGVHPAILSWRRKLLAESAEEAGKPLAGFEIWARTMVLVDDDLDRAREEVRSYASTNCFGTYLGTLRWPTPWAEELKAALPRKVLDEITTVGERYDYYEHESPGAKHAAHLSDETLSAYVLYGPPSRVIEQIEAMQEAGMDRISMVLYALKDQKKAMRRFVEEVYPRVS